MDITTYITVELKNGRSFKMIKIMGFILHLNNFNQEITLLAYCLMPNHFHLFIQQKSPGSIDKFMNSLCSRYASYFNRKYKRVGALFQGVYKAILVTNEAQYLHLSRYIHLQALALQGTPLKDGQPSSYPEYLGTRNTPWVHPEDILSFFSKNAPALSYESFVRDYAIYSSLGNLALEDD
jgi:putative transposase